MARLSDTVCPACQHAVPLHAGLATCPECGLDFAANPPAVSWVVKGIDLRTVARRQRLLIWCVGVSILLTAFAFLPASVAPTGVGGSIAVLVSLAITILNIALSIAAVVLLLSMMAAMKVGIVWRIIVAILMFAPCISLLVLISMNQRAVKMLQNAGLKVRLFGVSDDQVLRVMDPYRCRGCGYSLLHNTTGRCPECGMVALRVQVGDGK